MARIDWAASRPRKLPERCSGCVPSTSNPLLPSTIRTDRVLLRRQQPQDAPLVKEAGDSGLPHLQASAAWARTAPEPLRLLQTRLAAAAAAFDAGDDWTFSIFDQA